MFLCVAYFLGNTSADLKKIGSYMMKLSKPERKWPNGVLAKTYSYLLGRQDS